MAMSENEFGLSAAQEHQLLYAQGLALTGDAYEAVIYHDAVILGFPFQISLRQDGTAFVDLTPLTEKLDAQLAQAGFIQSTNVASGNEVGKSGEQAVSESGSASPTEITIVDLLQEQEREKNRQNQRRFRRGLKDKPEEVQEQYRGYKRTYRQKPEVKAAEAERQRRRRAKQEPQDPQVTD